MRDELEMLDHLNDTVTRKASLVSFSWSCRPEQVSREISENLLQRLGDSLEQDASALRRLWQSYGSPAAAGRTCSSPAAGRFSICRCA